MPIDAGIYGAIQAPKQVNPLDQYAQMQQIQSGQNQNKLSELMLGDKQRESESQTALANAYKAATDPTTGAIDRNKLYGALAQGGQGAKLPTVQKGFADQDKAAADTQKAKIESHIKELDAMGQILSGVKDQASWEAARTQAAQMFGAEKVNASMPPQYDAALVGQKRDQALSVKDQLEQKWKAMEYTTPKADARLSADTSRANNAATVGATIRGQDMTDARKREELQGAEAAFTPDAIKNAAARYNIDGTLPPMGMGKAGSAGRAAILNEAAMQAGASGVSPDDQRIAQIGNKANTAALTKIQQQQTMVGAFEKNFNKNADIALELSGKVDRTGVPLANKWINAGKRSITGDSDLSAFDASVKAVSNEYAKIISGSMGNTATAEGEIKKIEGLLNAAQTPEQLASVINLMKRETHNRMQGFEDEKTTLRSTMTTKKPAPSGVPADIAAILAKHK